MCSEKGPSEGYNKIYYKWYCPKAKQRCYVKEDDIYTYFKYLTQYGARGGKVKYYEAAPGIEIWGIQKSEDFMERVAAISIYSGEEGRGDVWLTVSSLKFATGNSRFPCTIS
jgi:hypothetical protein